MSAAGELRKECEVCSFLIYKHCNGCFVKNVPDGCQRRVLGGALSEHFSRCEKEDEGT